MSKLYLKAQAEKLRNEGYSYSYILSKVPVSKGTLSLWLSELPFTPNEHTKKTLKKSTEGMIRSKQEVKKASIKSARDQAERDLGLLSKRDMFMLGLGLYLSEGSKTHNNVRIVHSDPKIIAIAIRWFKTLFHMKDEHFAIRLHLYPGDNVQNCLDFWSKETGLGISQFQKVQIDRRKAATVTKRGKSYGTAHLMVMGRGKREFGVVLARRIQAWVAKVLQ